MWYTTSAPNHRLPLSGNKQPQQHFYPTGTYCVPGFLCEMSAMVTGTFVLRILNAWRDPRGISTLLNLASYCAIVATDLYVGEITCLYNLDCRQKFVLLLKIFQCQFDRLFPPNSSLLLSRLRNSHMTRIRHSYHQMCPKLDPLYMSWMDCSPREG